VSSVFFLLALLLVIVIEITVTEVKMFRVRA
jgi:hypothetical protein